MYLYGIVGADVMGYHCISYHSIVSLYVLGREANWCRRDGIVGSPWRKTPKAIDNKHNIRITHLDSIRY